MKVDITTAWQRVHTINDYYDGAVFGVADFEGKPHVYEAQWNDVSEEYGPMFRLSEIEPELLALVLEDWAIWLRWEAALPRGSCDTGNSSCTALGTLAP